MLLVGASVEGYHTIPSALQQAWNYDLKMSRKLRCLCLWVDFNSIYVLDPFQMVSVCFGHIKTRGWKSWKFDVSEAYNSAQHGTRKYIKTIQNIRRHASIQFTHTHVCAHCGKLCQLIGNGNTTREIKWARPGRFKLNSPHEVSQTEPCSARARLPNTVFNSGKRPRRVLSRKTLSLKIVFKHRRKFCWSVGWSDGCL